MNDLNVVDMFCGGGGESCGLAQATHEAGYKIHLTAINHWETAIQTHSANYPSAEHLCEAVEHLDPLKVIPGGRVDLLWASPECTHHSIARGGRPRSEQSRASAWMILKWLSELHVERVIIENVKEFLTWGALDVNGIPIPELKGKMFQAFIDGLRSLGYVVDWRLLRACDYGAPTTRERLFIQAIKGSKKIVWPEITHFDGENLAGHNPWIPARSIIDWSIKGESIFSRKKPLAENTLRRIEMGIKRFWGKSAEPFLRILRGASTIRSVDAPLPTVTTSGAHYGLVTPFLTKYYGTGENIDSINPPLSTITTKERFALVEPFITQIGQTSVKNRSRSLDEPLTTICTKNEHCLIEPFILPDEGFYRGNLPRSIEEPLNTVTSRGAGAIISPDIDKEYQLDIRFRMLTPSELARAQGFPEDYVFTGNKAEQVKQIGNAVPPAFARALYKTILEAS